MQFTPFETHLIPVIEFRHAALVVRILSEHCFNLQTGASVEFAKGVCQKQSPSVPNTHPACALYYEHVLSDIQPVPEVVHFVLAKNAEHPL